MQTFRLTMTIYLAYALRALVHIVYTQAKEA